MEYFLSQLMNGLCQGAIYALMAIGYSVIVGVVGMVSSPAQGLRAAIRGKKTPDEGVRVRTSGGGLIVDLHIVVIYGMNIAAVTRSIVNRVRYTVEQATGLEVAKVNVFVDAMKTENA